MKRPTLNLLIALGLVLLGAGIRLLPHPANFAPITAIAIFGGSVLPRRLAVWTPLAAMMASDLIIGLYKLAPVTWGCFALIALASSYALKKANFKRVLVLTLSSSLFFFVATNFAVWLWGGMYAHTLSGLQECFTLAVPFFRNTLLSDLFYTTVLFSSYVLAVRWSFKAIHKQKLQST